MDNIGVSSQKENNGQIFTLKIKKNNQSDIVDNAKNNPSLPMIQNKSDDNKLIKTVKPLKLIIVNKPQYEDNILLFNSIINETENFLNSVFKMQEMVPPIVRYGKNCRYTYDMVVNKSREKFGLIFDYSLTNPEDITHARSKVSIRCMICTYKQTINADAHLNGKGCGNCGNKCLWYYEFFIYEAFLIHGDKYIYPIIKRDKRITLKEHFDIICKKCKYIWPTTINNHIYGKCGCPRCSLEERKWNYDKLMEAVIIVHGYKFNYSKVIPSEINSCYSQFIIICNTCDYEWPTDVTHHINGGSGCPSCAGNAPWTYERFLTAAFKIHGNKYYYGLVKPEDICNSKSPFKLWCGKCDYYWETNINNHINRKTGCKSCLKKVPWTYVRFIEKAQLIHGNKYNYELVSPDDIKGYKSIINIICLTCKYNWSTTITNHINHKCNCPKCTNHLTYNLEKLIIKIIEIHCDAIDYSFVKSEHITTNMAHIPLICNKCQKCWSPTINNLINNKSGCPRCKISKGERACLNYLLSNNISFEEQFKIVELGNKSFDFMIEHNELKYIIEFDGVQHFKFVEYFYKSVDVFIKRQDVDVLKTITALKCGYNVIRIDYKQIDNVSFHLSEALNLKNKTYFSTPELYTHIIRKLEII
jgi:very-short-patch-repair endonuclease